VYNPPSDAAHRRHIASAYDEPGTGQEIDRRTFMANATLAIGGIVGLVLAIPIIGSLVPTGGAGEGTWAALDPKEWSQLQTATDKPVRLNFSVKYKDAYLPEGTLDEFVWGIKTSEVKMRKARPELFSQTRAGVPYPAVVMGFTVFSPICPHLGCRYSWNSDMNKFACPCHGSTYNFEGVHEAGPAPRGLDPLPLRERSGKAEVTWIRYDKATPDRVVISYAS